MPVRPVTAKATTEGPATTTATAPHDLSKTAPSRRSLRTSSGSLIPRRVVPLRPPRRPLLGRMTGLEEVETGRNLNPGRKRSNSTTSKTPRTTCLSILMNPGTLTHDAVKQRSRMVHPAHPLFQEPKTPPQATNTTIQSTSSLTDPHHVEGPEGEEGTEGSPERRRQGKEGGRRRGGTNLRRRGLVEPACNVGTTRLVPSPPFKRETPLIVV